jgi:putative flavoprotein involved in K+ transport
MEYVESVIIGGGQAGLATSYYLKQAVHEHIIFEKSSHPGNVWRTDRWDSFTLVTPNWSFRMPGHELKNDNEEGFMSRTEVIDFFEDYTEKFNLPVMYNNEVYSVEHSGREFLVKTEKGDFKARNVVTATGFFQKPRRPHFTDSISDNVLQLDSTRYRNPKQLPEGAVLVVGSGQSGAQITEELYLSGRKVFLSTGCTSGRVPRRYRGKDIIAWFDMMGFFDLSIEQMPPGSTRFDAIPHVSGSGGGHTLNLHRFKREGVTLLGHLRNADENKIFINPDLHSNLARIDNFEKGAVSMIDEFIKNTNMNVPAEELDNFQDGYSEPEKEVLDLRNENIQSIIWCCGYSFDYGFIKVPVFDSEKYPLANRGVTEYPGLYFVGLPWMPSQRSGFLIGTAEFARETADRITETSQKKQPAGVS